MGMNAPVGDLDAGNFDAWRDAPLDAVEQRLPVTRPA